MWDEREFEFNCGVRVEFKIRFSTFFNFEKYFSPSLSPSLYECAPVLHKHHQTQYTVIDDTVFETKGKRERKNMQIAISFTRCIFILVATSNFVLSYLRFSMRHRITNTLKYLCINCCMNYSIAYWDFGWVSISVACAHCSQSFYYEHHTYLQKTTARHTPKKESNTILCNHYHHSRWLLTTVKLLSFEFHTFFSPVIGYPANYFVHRFTP